MTVDCESRCLHCRARCDSGGCFTCMSSRTFCGCGALLRCGCGLVLDHPPCPNVRITGSIVLSSNLDAITPKTLVLDASTPIIYSTWSSLSSSL